MRIAFGLVLIAIAVSGCGRPNTSPELRCVDVGVDETSHPAGIAVMVENKGTAPAQVSTTAALVEWKYLLVGKNSGEAIPAEFDYDVGLPRVSIPGGATQPVEFDFRWNVAADSPPMLAIVHTRFVVEFEQGNTVTTEPVTF